MKANKILFPLVVQKPTNANGGKGIIRMVRIRRETEIFIKWVRNDHNKNFEARKEQLKVLDSFFALEIGGGRTTLINLLKKFDQ